MREDGLTRGILEVRSDCRCLLGYGLMCVRPDVRVVVSRLTPGVCIIYIASSLRSGPGVFHCDTST